MSFINYSSREINCKIVYYGPGLCGKTTNLQYIYAKTNPEAKGKMISLETETERTLFFDFLPLSLGEIRGFKTRFHLYTVPGQVIHDTTRRIVLQNADGIVFVADSQLAENESNRASFRDLKRHLRENLLPPDLPMVVQFNKRDLPGIRSERELAAFAARRGTPVYRAVAVRGLGVRETLAGLLLRVWRRLQASPEWVEHLTLPAEAFVGQVLDGWQTPAEADL